MSFKEIRFRGKSARYFMHELGLPRFNEIDNYGVVWNGHFVNYFETGRLALCGHFGFTMELLSQMGIFLPVHKYEVTMRKPVFPQEKVSIAVRPTELTETVMEFHHLLLVGDEIRAMASVQHVAMSKESKEITFTLSQETREVLEPLRKEFFP